MDIVLISELSVPFLAGCFIGSRVVKNGLRQVMLIALVAVPLGLLVSTARLTDRANVGRWYDSASWPGLYFLGLGCSVAILGFVLMAVVVSTAAWLQTKWNGQ